MGTGTRQLVTYKAEYFEAVRGVIVNECGDGMRCDVVLPRLAWVSRRINRTAVVSVTLHRSERPSSLQLEYGTMCKHGFPLIESILRSPVTCSGRTC